MQVIRDYRADDGAAIMAILESETATTQAAVGAALADHTNAVVWADPAIRGLALTKAHWRDYAFCLYVAPAHRGQGIGGKLYQHVWPSFAGSGLTRATATYRCDTGHARDFFARRGFVPWYTLVYLTYHGGRQPEPAGIDVVPYSQARHDVYVDVLARSFYEMRRARDFQPYDVSGRHNTDEAKERLQTMRDDHFLAYDAKGRAVGCACIEGDMIDIIGVVPDAQGSGYGRALTQFCINTLLDRGLTPQTAYVADNHGAGRLYLSLGFLPTEAHEDALLIIAREDG
jgi:GNAT superfamily N-acetyltransferase